MPVVVTDVPVQVDPPRRRWTRAEYEALSSLGALEGQKMELVEGELINKMGKKRPHSNSLELLQRMLLGVFGRRLNRETPIDVAPDDNPTNEPEPDLIVLKRDLSEFQENPRPGDVDLVVEIADTTLGFDRGIKARLYARAG